MHEELIKEMIAYIEGAEEQIAGEWGEGEAFNELLKNGEAPELYHKLVKLLT